jgi:hypothetical protein
MIHRAAKRLSIDFNRVAVGLQAVAQNSGMRAMNEQASAADPAGTTNRQVKRLA